MRMKKLKKMKLTKTETKFCGKIRLLFQKENINIRCQEKIIFDSGSKRYIFDGKNIFLVLDVTKDYLAASLILPNKLVKKIFMSVLLHELIKIRKCDFYLIVNDSTKMNTVLSRIGFKKIKNNEYKR